MKAIKIFEIVLAPIAVIMFLLVTIVIFGTGILFMQVFESHRDTKFGAYVWRRLENIGWLWTSFMWGACLIPFMWIRRKVTGAFPPLPVGTQRITSGNHPSYIACLGSAYATTVMDRTPLKIIGKVENLNHPVNGFLLHAAQLLGWAILLDRRTPGLALRQLNEALTTITESVAYLLYVDKHRFTSKWRQKDIEKYAKTIARIQDFDQTLVPSTSGMWEILSTLRTKCIPVQVIDTTILFDCVDLGFWSMFRIFGSVLHIEIEDITKDIDRLKTEEQLRDYMNEYYRHKNQRMRDIRGLPHPQ